uniref:Uncharacterized protein n=1 Tax=Arundo donax TaxID=35708 RepID=A0A0A9A2N5_ARUDO
MAQKIRVPNITISIVVSAHLGI